MECDRLAGAFKRRSVMCTRQRRQAGRTPYAALQIIASCVLGNDDLEASFGLPDLLECGRATASGVGAQCFVGESARERELHGFTGDAGDEGNADVAAVG